MCQSKCNTAKKAGEAIKMKSDEILELKQINTSLEAQVAAVHSRYDEKLEEYRELALVNQSLVRQIDELKGALLKSAQRTNQAVIAAATHMEGGRTN